MVPCNYFNCFHSIITFYRKKCQNLETSKTLREHFKSYSPKIREKKIFPENLALQNIVTVMALFLQGENNNKTIMKHVSEKTAAMQKQTDNSDAIRLFSEQARLQHTQIPNNETTVVIVLFPLSANKVT